MNTPLYMAPQQRPGQLRIGALLLPLLISSTLPAQQRIDGTFPFQTDLVKQYSIYVPSSYTPGTPHRLMLGLHPLNTARWNSISWCDTLIVFAETNGLLLVCPDGGADGAIDDPIDTAFTTALLDSMDTWYSIDHDKVYVMGFSWGGRTTYTYGLLRPQVFRGYLPIGAAINGLAEVNTTMQAYSAGKPVYIVHGGSDSPSTRYTPILDALNANGAMVNSILMPGIGHTIDFPNRNAILGVAFQWIDSVNCAALMTAVRELPSTTPTLRIVPNIIGTDRHAQLEVVLTDNGSVTVDVLDGQGKAIRTFNAQLPKGSSTIELDLNGSAPGNYVLKVRGAAGGSLLVVLE